MLKLKMREALDIYNLMVVLSESPNKEIGWFAARNMRKLKPIVERYNIENQPSKEFVDFMVEAKKNANDLCLKDENGQFILSEDKKYTFENDEKKEEYQKKQKELHEKNTKMIQEYELSQLKKQEEEIEIEPYKIQYSKIPTEYSGKLLDIIFDFIEQ